MYILFAFTLYFSLKTWKKKTSAKNLGCEYHYLAEKSEKGVKTISSCFRFTKW